VRIRQVALVAREIEPTVQDLCAALGVEVAYRDPAIRIFGLENAVMPVGDTFLEVVSPVQPNTSAGRFLDHRGGDGGYMVIVQSDDLERHRKHLAELGVRIVWETTAPDIATIHLHPRDVGGAILSLDVARPPESWRWAGPDWETKVRTDVTSAIVGVELEADDPGAMASRWSQILERPATSKGDGLEILLDAGTIRFSSKSERRGDGIAALEFAVVDRGGVSDRARGAAVSGEEIRVCGTRIRFC
jgi:hypothetical protein